MVYRHRGNGWNLPDTEESIRLSLHKENPLASAFLISQNHGACKVTETKRPPISQGILQALLGLSRITLAKGDFRQAVSITIYIFLK